MKITDAQIRMQSQHLLQHEQSREESLKVWVGNERPPVAADPQTTTAESGESGDRLTLSRTAFRHSRHSPRPAKTPQEASAPSGSGEDPKLTAMRLILEALTGKRITIAKPQEFKEGGAPVALPSSDQAGEGPAASTRAGWGLEYDLHLTLSEHEETAFAANGEVRTEEGLSLQVAMEMTMSRDFVETTDIQIRAGDALLVDPLVINFSDHPPMLSEEKIGFDLDSDGQEEQISMVTPGSGFLFLDRNNDGLATDGSELFGPRSGSGFQELAALDSDANGWLDDNDPLFAKLQVWVKDTAGSDYFAPLKSFRVGALLLDHQATPFSLNDQHNRQLGQITDTGLFLREDGSSGTLQEIHLTV